MGADWQVQRYLAFDSASASINSQNVLDGLGDNIWRNLVTDGYVATDSNGEALLYRDEVNDDCYAYVFQTSGAGFGADSISSCPEGSGGAQCGTTAAWTFQNCEVAIVTLPAEVTFSGTLVTVVYAKEMQLLVVMAHEGMAKVSPQQGFGSPFGVEAGSGGYIVDPKYQAEMEDLFGVPPGTAVPIEKLAAPLEKIGATAQMHRANMVLLVRDLPVIPVQPTFDLAFTPQVERDRSADVATAFSMLAPWEKLLGETVPGAALWYESEPESLFLNTAPYEPEKGRAWLKDLTGTEKLILWYAPGLKALAERVSAELTASGMSVETRELEAGKPPTVAGDGAILLVLNSR